MTIQNKLDYLAQTKSLIKDAIIAKGGVIDDSTPFRQYADIITDLPSGGGGIGIPREVTNETLSFPSTSFEFESNCTDIGSYVLENAFRSCRTLDSVKLTSLTNIRGAEALKEMCKNSSVKTVRMDNLKTVTGSDALYSAFHSSDLTSVDLHNLETVNGNNIFYSTFQQCAALSTVDLSGLKTIKGSYTFQNAFSNDSSLESVNLDNLVSVSGTSAMDNAFYYCRKLKGIDFKNLEVIEGSKCFANIFNTANLESLTFPKLKRIGSNTTTTQDYGHFSSAIYNINNIKEIEFPELEYIYNTGSDSSSYATFYNCNTVEKLYFPKLKDINYSPAYSGSSSSFVGARKRIFDNCSSLKEIHFGAANKAAITSTIGYSTAWGRGAGNVTIYFDLGGATVNFNVTPSDNNTLLVNGEESPLTFSTIEDFDYVVINRSNAVPVFKSGREINLQLEEVRNVNVDFSDSTQSELSIKFGDVNDAEFEVNGVKMVNVGNGIYKIRCADNSGTLHYELKSPQYQAASGDINIDGTDKYIELVPVFKDRYIVVDLSQQGTNPQWAVADYPNPAGVGNMYKSTNQGKSNSYSVMKVNIHGYDNFSCYIMNSSEHSSDYTIASAIDAATIPTSAGSGKFNARNVNGNINTFPSNWVRVEYDNLNGGDHYFYVVYSKDGSVDSNLDTGFIILDENQSYGL